MLVFKCSEQSQKLDITFGLKNDQGVNHVCWSMSELDRL